ncbi:YbaB/EbfC family nucleoid-associated protein [Glycomyces buryatensis]|uniref:YbaB/EbfC family nucleoid-associated protein n=1 Tax=Glycomyces buryatensis TaxID=2570927 RepID=A0A4S8Q8S6_9ACTN|nr:YbaB/EbfC family nucleoid-associated protein [Glycomyces buryatensis]THV40807.1 YbaB/EbfC family nucleoid-associated protein [Glycomyces buryatensis]
MLNPEAARARLEERKARFEQMASQTQAMAEQMKALSVTVSDSNGLITVKVDSTGNLTGIELSDRTRRVTPDVVSRTIMETIAEAKRRIVEQTGEVIAATVGADSETGKAVAASLKQRLDSDAEGQRQ